MPRRLALACFAAVLLAGCGNLLDTAAATVDGSKIEEEPFVRQVEFLVADPRFSEQVPVEEQDQAKGDLARDYLTFLIHQQLVSAYAGANEIEVADEDVDAFLQQQIDGLGGEEAFGRILAQAEATRTDVQELLEEQLLRQQVAEAVVAEEVTDEQLRATYEERALEFAEIDTAHILVRTEAEAERVLRQATPENFADLARRLSEDTSSAENGGSLGPQRAADLVAPFANAALEIPVGEIGGPVETDFGFHVIHVIDRQVQPFETVRDALLEEVRSQVFTDWLFAGLQDAEIRVNPRYGYFDEQSGSVLERRSSTPLPAPSIQLEP